MEKLFVMLLMMSITAMVAAQKPNTGAKSQIHPADTANIPVFQWEKTSHDFGKIFQGKPVTITFVFTNVGKAPLVITGVHPSCGCTTQDFTKEFVAPGKQGFVRLTYNALALGVFTKNATVTANTNPDTMFLIFNGEVIADVNAGNH